MYKVELTATAADDLGRLDKTIAQRIINKIQWLSKNFDILTLQPLSGQFGGVFKLRVGDYRILYIYDKIKARIVIHFVRHRREVYKIR
jgi:mRNA interferase RelE/StbE